MAKNLLIRVPENELSSFGKRIFFEINGDICCTFANKIDENGYLCYPFNNKNNEKILLLFAYGRLQLDTAVALQTSYTSKKIIITEAQNKEIEDYEILDISNLKDYYQTELSLDKFIDKYFYN